MFYFTCNHGLSECSDLLCYNYHHSRSFSHASLGNFERPNFAICNIEDNAHRSTDFSYAVAIVVLHACAAARYVWPSAPSLDPQKY